MCLSAICISSLGKNMFFLWKKDFLWKKRNDFFSLEKKRYFFSLEKKRFFIFFFEKKKIYKFFIQVLCPFFNWDLCVFDVELYTFFIYFRYQSFTRYFNCKYFLPFSRQPVLLILSFVLQKFLAWCSPISFIFAFVSLFWGDTSKKNIAKTDVKKKYCQFSSGNTFSYHIEK